MKRHAIITTLLLLLLALAETIKAQSYHSYFGADSTRLNIYEVCVDFSPTIYLLINSADTVHINGHDYLQGFPQGEYSDFFDYGDLYFREDTATGRLYRFDPRLGDEILLSDMSLMVGDTFSYAGEYQMYQTVVDSVFYEDGKKAIHFAGWHANHVGMMLREGLFPSYVPLGIVNGCDSFLLCEYLDGEQVFSNPNPNFDSCYMPNILSVFDEQKQQITVYPTSACSFDRINIEASEPIMEITLIDLFGRELPIICSHYSPYHCAFTIPNCVSGIYFITIRTPKSMCYEKIIIHS